MTNSEKFKEVFGFYPDTYCLIPKRVCFEKDDCDECVFEDWWQQEYKECFELKEEYECKDN